VQLLFHDSGGVPQFEPQNAISHVFSPAMVRLLEIVGGAATRMTSDVRSRRSVTFELRSSVPETA
jgi:hypothetical protein